MSQQATAAAAGEAQRRFADRMASHLIDAESQVALLSVENDLLRGEIQRLTDALAEHTAAAEAEAAGQNVDGPDAEE